MNDASSVQTNVNDSAAGIAAVDLGLPEWRCDIIFSLPLPMHTLGRHIRTDNLEAHFVTTRAE